MFHLRPKSKSTMPVFRCMKIVSHRAHRGRREIILSSVFSVSSVAIHPHENRSRFRWKVSIPARFGTGGEGRRPGFTGFLAECCDAIHPHIRPDFLVAAGPLYDDSFQVWLSPKTKMDAAVARAQVTAVGVCAAPQRLLPLSERRHSRPDPEAIIFNSFQSNHKPMGARADLIQQQPRRAVVIGDNDIDVAVIVDVAEGSPAAHLGKL